MKTLFTFGIAVFFATAALAQAGAQSGVQTGVRDGAAALPEGGIALLAPEAGTTPNTVDLKQFLWKKRVLVVFADSPGDPRFVEQMALLGQRTEDLAQRDVVLLIDTDPGAPSALREKFRPHGFAFVLLGKDGNTYLRKPVPWDVREISRSIDKMPLRRQEIRNR